MNFTPNSYSDGCPKKENHNPPQLSALYPQKMLGVFCTSPWDGEKGDPVNCCDLWMCIPTTD
jgi:hypothetical protein